MQFFRHPLTGDGGGIGLKNPHYYRSDNFCFQYVPENSGVAFIIEIYQTKKINSTGVFTC
ncbi:MAG: hypothetical protein CVU55_03745 [Deltaproteobacteria bacterium HGW-Deltaproteobacteria-13]|jgi:hypothetical protein|nr:MAG: hypothetical protein CVU55_03745 [Deltaproteobacteria bacterium HGW-Deltaproteobacteria-13]